MLPVTTLDHTVACYAASQLSSLTLDVITHCQQQGIPVEALFQTPAHQLLDIGFSKKCLDTFHKLNWHKIQTDLDWFKQQGATLLTFDHPDYPIQLKNIVDPPLFLSVFGDAQCLNKPAIAMVGARQATYAACRQATLFAQALAQSGLVITSGLALGIDAAAHWGVVSASTHQGNTVAVLGTGLGEIYPRRHADLAKQILDKGGAIVSEFPPHTPPLPRHFPQRNRIISGLSLGVVVIEAARKSGSLITARFALEQGREVFAVPGSIQNPLTEGCHALIQEGALLVTKPEDILQALPHFVHFVAASGEDKAAIVSKALTQEQLQCLACIDYAPTSMDTIMQRYPGEPSPLPRILLNLELVGAIQLVAGGYTREC